MKDPYALLGVARSATEPEIKSAYRKLAKELHPDKNTGNPKAAERFSDVTRAYDFLSDKGKRARFDRGEIDGEGNPANPFGGFGGSSSPFGANRGGGQSGARSGGGFGEAVGMDFGDIFDGLFGAGGQRGGTRAGARPQSAPPAKGADISYRLKVQLIDAATLAPQRITLADGKSIDLKLPAGVEQNSKMRLPGKGQPGPGGTGDAVVIIEVAEHPFFTREGDHVRIDLPISIKEAVQGGKVRVPTVDGPVMLGIPRGSASGTVLRLKGKGFTRKDKNRGDQLVTLMIDVPADNDALNAFVADWDDDRAIRSDLGV
jgi:DnaJ-class molecular chaperone